MQAFVRFVLVLIVLTATVMTETYAQPDDNFRAVEDDNISPSLVDHRSLQFFEGENLEQMYNYIYYEFDVNGNFYWARSYLDDIRRVTIYGPFSDRTRSDYLTEPINGDIVAYFRRRFAIIETPRRFGDGFRRLD